MSPNTTIHMGGVAVRTPADPFPGQFLGSLTGALVELIRAFVSAKWTDGVDCRVVDLARVTSGHTLVTVGVVKPRNPGMILTVTGH